MVRHRFFDSKCSSTIPELIHALLHKIRLIWRGFGRCQCQRRIPTLRSLAASGVLPWIHWTYWQPSPKLIKFHPSCASLGQPKRICPNSIDLREHRRRPQRRHRREWARTWNWVCHELWRCCRELCLPERIKPKSESSGFRVRRWDWFWTRSWTGWTTRRLTQLPELFAEKCHHLLTRRNRTRWGKLLQDCYHAFLRVWQQLGDDCFYLSTC